MPLKIVTILQWIFILNMLMTKKYLKYMVTLMWLLSGIYLRSWFRIKTLDAVVSIATPFTVYPKKFAHGFCFAVLCCGYTLTDFLISIRLTSLALWQSNDCPSASKATLMNMDKYFMWIHYERLHNHNKAKHNKTVCIFLGIYCRYCCFGKTCPRIFSLQQLILSYAKY